MSTPRSIAHALIAAREAGRSPIPYPGPVPSSLSEAYAIQDEMIAAASVPVIGWKVARLPAPSAAELGQDGIVGPIFGSQPSNKPAAPGVGIFPGGYGAGEAEYLLQLGGTASALDRACSLEQAADAIGSVHVGIEVASSPVGDIFQLGAPAIASDLGINSGIIIGPRVVDWQQAGLEEWAVTTEVDGAVVGHGQASSLANGFAGSLVILLAALAARGHRLSAGQWVASGAITGVHLLKVGETLRVDFGGRLEVTYAAAAASG